MKPEEVINNLAKIYHENQFSHAYLVETNNIESCLLDIKKLIKMTFCPKKYNDNCDECNLCHLLDNNSLPSVYVLDTDSKSINKDSIDELKSQFFYNPVYTLNNYYVICHAERMNDTAYNRLLKFLEEPDSNIIGFYLCENIQKMPDTIVSRLEKIKIYYADNAKTNDEIMELANEYLGIVTKDNSKGIWYNNSVLNKKLIDRMDFINLFKYMLDICLKENRYKLSGIIKDYLLKMEYNVNIMLLLDSFVIELGDFNE